jgi:hypothetical protein
MADPDEASDAPAEALRAVGSVQDAFALMLHDRLVDLERSVAALMPAGVDRRLAVLGKTSVADSGAAFVRVRSSWSADTEAVLEGVLGAMGRVDRARWDAWCCQHWSCLLDRDAYVLELLVQRAGSRGVDVVAVAHAALDAVRREAQPFGLAHTVSAEACAVRSPAWFAESIRTACHATGRAAARSWDPDTRSCAPGVETPHEGDDSDRADAAWTMLHGWLASQTEAADVWHPRALNAAASGQELVAALRRVLE